MAYQTGTANGHLDLLDKFKTFISTNVDLVAAGQNWQVLRDDISVPWRTFTDSRIAWGNTACRISWPALLPDGLPVGVPNANIKYAVKGGLPIATTGTYTFGFTGGPSVELLIDGVVVLSTYQNATVDTSWLATVAVPLTAGAHTFEVRLLGDANNTKLWLSVAMSAVNGAINGVGSLMPMTALTSPQYMVDYSYSPVATNHSDFSSQWDDRVLCLRGPGLSATDNIYVNLFTSSSVSSDLYNLNMAYAGGFEGVKLTMDQPSSGPITSALLWNQSIKYWFVANGRRFIIATKVSTVYEALYGGFILPYGMPSEYPYPIAAGGNFANGCAARWSNQLFGHGSFWNPANDLTLPVGALVLRDPFGNNVNFSNGTYRNGSNYPNNIPAVTSPYFKAAYASGQPVQPGTQVPPGGTYALTPIVLHSLVSTAEPRAALPPGGKSNVFGEFDGVFHVSGYNNSSESVITEGSNNYLVLQSAFHTGSHEYAAILLG